MKFDITYTEKKQFKPMTRTTRVEASNEFSAVTMLLGRAKFENNKYTTSQYIVDKVEEIKDEVKEESEDVEQ